MLRRKPRKKFLFRTYLHLMNSPKYDLTTLKDGWYGQYIGIAVYRFHFGSGLGIPKVNKLLRLSAHMVPGDPLLERK